MKILLVLLCVFCVPCLVAQTSSFASLDSYLPLSGSELNPAMATESRGKWVVVPFKTDLNIYNNFFALSMPYSPYRLLANKVPKAYQTADGNPIWDWTWIKMNEQNSSIKLQTFFRSSGPAVLLRKGKYVWTFRSDVTGFASADGLPAQIVKQQVDNWNNDEGQPPMQQVISSGIQNASGTMSLSQQAYVSMSVGLARSFRLKLHKDIAFGVNYRVLHSLGGYFLKVKTGNIIYDSEKGVEVKSPSVYFAEMLPRNNRLWAHGLGSADIGVVYTYRNVETRRPGGYNDMHPDYKFKFGWSLLDIGNLVYTRTMVTDVSMKTNVKLPDPEEFENMTPEEVLEKYKNSFQKEISINNSTTYGNTVRVGLPLRMVFSMDMQLSKHLYWSNLYMQNLRRKNSNNVMVGTFVASGLRVAYKYLSVGVPFTYSNANKKVGLGANFRMGPLFFGTGNLGPFIKPKAIYAADFYFGIQITDLPGAVFKKKLPYMFTRKRGCADF
jgi:hypothetical protein